MDSKDKSTLGNAVLETIFSKIWRSKTTNAIWDVLTISYEGANMIKSQIWKNLIQKYENFYLYKNEYLASIHTRFYVLLNDLKGVGFSKSGEEICTKFLVILPDTCSKVITSLEYVRKLMTMIFLNCTVWVFIKLWKIKRTGET